MRSYMPHLLLVFAAFGNLASANIDLCNPDAGDLNGNGNVEVAAGEKKVIVSPGWDDRKIPAAQDCTLVVETAEATMRGKVIVQMGKKCTANADLDLTGANIVWPPNKAGAAEDFDDCDQERVRYVTTGNQMTITFSNTAEIKKGFRITVKA